MDSSRLRSTDCAILAIDPGRKSGAALFINRAFQDAWQVSDKAAERADVVHHAVKCALQDEVDLVAVVEGWPYIGGVRTAIGLGEASGRWKEQLELQGVPKRRIVKVGVNKWRKAVFGTLHQRHGREGWKANAIELSRQLFARDLCEDAAEAALLGRYATMAPEVLGVVPRRGRSK